MCEFVVWEVSDCGTANCPPIRGTFPPGPAREWWPVCREVMLTELKPKIPRFSAGDSSFWASVAFFRAC